MECIAYKDGYKYQLFDEYTMLTTIKPAVDITTNGDYVRLSTAGAIVIKKGYAWDGPSGPTIDTINFMRGSLVHDAFYQLMREGKLDKANHRDSADRLLQRMCIEDGMNSIRALLVYQALRVFGDAAASARNIKSVNHAPESCS